MQLPSTFNDLVEVSVQHNLYEKLVLQLNKDLASTNIDLAFNEDILPSSLKLVLQEAVLHLINERFSEYLNLLYIIDVSEHKVRQLPENDVLQLSEDVTLLILLREWQKVYYRHHYTQ